MDALAEFRRLLAELSLAKRDVARIEEEIRQLVADDAARQGLPYHACLQHFLQSVVDEESHKELS